MTGQLGELAFVWEQTSSTGEEIMAFAADVNPDSRWLDMCPAAAVARRLRRLPPPSSTTGGMTDNVVRHAVLHHHRPGDHFSWHGALQTRANFVRFHAFQMIFFCVAMIGHLDRLTVIGFVRG